LSEDAKTFAKLIHERFGARNWQRKLLGLFFHFKGQLLCSG
jgi:hypothetical protein